MKKFLVFTIVLYLSLVQANSCGYLPYGEDVRYSLFLPKYFDYADFAPFYYNANSFDFDFETVDGYSANITDWYFFANETVSKEAIIECVNLLRLSDMNSSSHNEFLQFLYKNKREDVVRYLIMAKKCEGFNSVDFGDPWERNEDDQRDYAMILSELQKSLEGEKDEYLRRKYAFLIIRIAYYKNDFDLIHKMFEVYFSQKGKDYLYYWASFFNCFENENSMLDVADILVNSEEKKFAAYYYFHRDFDLKKALLASKTPKDIAHLYAYASVQRLEPNLDYLRNIYVNSNKLRILDFLLLREINKLEDWIYTPYYTNYLPSVEFFKYWWSDSYETLVSTETLRNRSERDRLYAMRLLQFVRTVDLSKVLDVKLWKAAEIQLLFMTRQYESCLVEIAIFKQEFASEQINAQIEKIEVLCMISNQQHGKAIITNAAKTLILKYLNDPHFLFAVGRELEFRGNLADGMAMIAYKNNAKVSKYDCIFNDVEWQGNRLKKSGNLKYFYDYFDYLDFVYSADDLQIIINQLNDIKNEEFYKIIYKPLLANRNYLTDLLGTKYIRENRLSDAINTFQSIDGDYWNDNYNAWERDRFEDDYTFDKNPFYDFKYTYSFIPHKEIYRVTKLSVTEHLIKYLELAQNPETPDRDYNYFLVANCYLNMTQYGHSWMIRRFSSTTNYNRGNNESYIDEIEYRNGLMAKKYYHLAYQNAKTDKFKALCLRMEDYAIDNIDAKYKLLKDRYPEYYDDLSSCYNLNEYFMDR